jgi:hypothetical protein
VTVTDDYQADIADFAENEDCTPIEDVVKNPRCIEIAQRFGKTPEEVSRDINRHYIKSYRTLKIGNLTIGPVHDDETISIVRSGGEGGDFSIKQFIDIVEDFVSERL